MTHPVSSAIQAYERTSAAIEAAKERLKREGVEFPIFDGKTPYVEHEKLLQAYIDKETRYIIEYIRSQECPPVEKKKTNGQQKRPPAYHREWVPYGDKED